MPKGTCSHPFDGSQGGWSSTWDTAEGVELTNMKGFQLEIILDHLIVQTG